MPPHIFGIRHHGPGSARSLLRALEELRPDVILVEGPPDGADVLPLAAHPAMEPPVALLIYAPEQPRRAAYYPFAVFSPEWQAIRYALQREVPVRFIDLPQAVQLALEPDEDAAAPDEAAPAAGREAESPAPVAAGDALRQDPLAWLAAAAGYGDGERWWEHMVEQRRDSAGLFAAILEAMTALRSELEAAPASGAAAGATGRPAPRDVLREAHMRQGLRAAARAGCERIAVVCGAWHGPALADVERIPAKADAELLKGLPRLKVAATWVPWTNGRLTLASGYGAGIASPGWYGHLWHSPDHVSAGWLARVAHLLREQDLDASPASVVEAVRLAEALAALRDRPLPGLAELNEAAHAVLCHGAEMPLRLIGEKLVVGETLGRVPPETPQVALQRDLEREQRRLRLPPEPAVRELDLDLRKPTHLERSRLLHRLTLLDVPWGVTAEPQRSARGTFHEQWRLQWQPEFALALVEASRYGRTVAEAAAARAGEAAEQAHDLPALAGLLERVLLAELPEAAPVVIGRVQAEAALAGDVGLLMDSLPPLANLQRYGSVRHAAADTSQEAEPDPAAGMVAEVVDGLLARICIGLPIGCAALDDEAAALMFRRLVAVHTAVLLLQSDAQRLAWKLTLMHLADQAGLHGLLAGRCCRLLHDQGALEPGELQRRLGLALSPAAGPDHAAAWVEGLLSGSGLLLLHDDALWPVLDGWLTGLSADAFTQALPLLRRTFATFSGPERRQMAERTRNLRAGPMPGTPGASAAFDTARAEAVLPLLGRVLGVDTPL